MATEQDWARIIAAGERRNVEFKKAMAWHKDSRDRLSQALVACANTRDGGKVIIGVSEDTNADKAPEVLGIGDADAATYDPSRIGEFLGQNFQPAVAVRVERVTAGEKNLLVLVVDEFASVPVVCVKASVTLNDKGKPYFKPGDVLIRTAAAQSRPIQSGEEMSELLRLSITKTKDNLLEDIQRILEGPSQVPPTPSPASVGVAASWETRVREIRNDLTAAGQPGTFEFSCSFDRAVVAPTEDELHEKLKDATIRSRVDKANWGEFPMSTRYDTMKNADRFVTVARLGIDRWAGYQREIWIHADGFFGYIEDRLEAVAKWGTDETRKRLDGRRPLLSERAAATVAAAIDFIVRFSELLAFDGSVRLTFTWTALKNTILVLDGPFGVELHYECIQDTVTSTHDKTLLELRSARGQVLRAVLRKVLSMYQMTANERDGTAEVQVRRFFPNSA